MTMPTLFPDQQYINGHWTPAAHGGTWDLVNPATEAVIAQVAFGDAADASAAVAAAARAFPAWSAQTPYARAGVLLRAADWVEAHADALARLSTEECGKPLRESKAEWRSAANYLRYFSEEGKRLYGRVVPSLLASRRIFVTRVPLGVVASITAWNFPIYNVVRAVGAALAAGCTIVARPSEYTPRSAWALAAAFAQAGAPPGVVNVINGDPAAMAEVFLNDARVRKISFTGSTRVGKLLMDGASRTVTRLGLEMGGNAPVLVAPDVRDVPGVARRSVQWKLRNAGQVCVAPQRFYVPSRHVEEFVDVAAAAMRDARPGDTLSDDRADVGPLINARQRERVIALVDDARAAGAEVLVGGGVPEGLARGYFYAPTLVANITAAMPLVHEEIFGPVMPIIPYDDLDDAVAQANATEYGLAAFVQTDDLNTALHLAERLEYGMVCINDWLPATPEAPFVGVKQSGLGAESGPEGLADYTDLKTVMVGGL